MNRIDVAEAEEPSEPEFTHARTHRADGAEHVAVSLLSLFGDTCVVDVVNKLSAVHNPSGETGRIRSFVPQRSAKQTTFSVQTLSVVLQKITNIRSIS